MLAIHHVIGQRTLGKRHARRRCETIGQTTGRSVDDDIVSLHRLIRPRTHTQIAGADNLGKISVLLNIRQPCLRFIQAAIFHHHASGQLIQNRAQHTARRTACAEQQYVFPSQTHAQILGDIAHQTHAVGIVRFNLTVSEAQCIARARPQHIRRALARIGKRIQFEWHGDIASTQILRAQRVNGGGKTINRCKHTLIAKRNAELLGKLCVDER